MTAFISWTTPQMRAERALAEVAVHMEFGRFSEARASLAEAVHLQHELMQCIDAEEARRAEIARNQVPADVEAKR